MTLKRTLAVSIAVLLVALLLNGCGGPKPEQVAPPTTPVTGTGAGGSGTPGAATNQVVYRVTDHWNDVEKLYQFYGKSIQPWGQGSPVPAPELCPRGLDKVKDPVIAAHPARSGKGDVGETILRFATALPSGPTQLVFGAYLTKSTAPTDGAEFQVRVGGERLFSKVVMDYSPQQYAVDLSKYAGRTVTIELVTTPGPAKNTSADWARWVDPKIVTPG